MVWKLDTQLEIMNVQTTKFVLIKTTTVVPAMAYMA